MKGNSFVNDRSTASSSATTLEQGNTTLSSSRTSNKKRKLAFICAGAAAALLVLAAIIYLVFFYVSKADYRHAESQTNTVISAYNKLNQAEADWSSATDSELTQKKAAYESASKAYQSAAMSLGNERALRDGKVKAAYDSFLAKNKAFVANSAVLEQTIPLRRNVILKCNDSTIGDMSMSDLSQLVATYDKALGPCIGAAKDLSSSKDTSAAAVGKSMVGYYADMRTHLVAMQQAYTANDRTTFESEYKKYFDTEGSYDFRADLTKIQKQQDGLLPQNELNHLASVIQPLQ